MTGMPRDLGQAVAAGLLSAVLVLAVLSGSGVGLVSSYAAALPLMAVGLSLGLMAALVAGISGVVGVGLATGGAVVPYTLLISVPAVALVRQALLWRSRADGVVEWCPPGRLLGWLFGVACLGIALVAMISAGEPEGFPGVVAEQVRLALDSLGDAVTPREREQLTALWVPYLPAMVGSIWVLMMVLNGVLAQGAVARLGRNLRPSPAYTALSLPDWLGWAVVAGAVVAMLADGSLGYAARNAAVLLLTAYVFPGLAWIHGSLRAKPGGGTWLVMFYGVFVVAFVWAVIVVAAIGLIRHWMVLGRNWSSPGQEEK